MEFVDYQDDCFELDDIEGDDCFDTPLPCPDMGICFMGSHDSFRALSESKDGILIVAVGKICQVLRKYFVEKLELVRVGVVVGSDTQTEYSAVFAGANIVLIAVENQFPEQLVRQWTRLFGDMLSNRCSVCLGGVASSAMVTSADVLSYRSPAHIRHITTTAFQSLVSGNESLSASLGRASADIGAGNIITGVIAGVLSFSEARNSAAIALLSVMASSSVFTVESAAVLEKLIPLIGELLQRFGTDKQLPCEKDPTYFHPTVYKSLAQRDGFTISTSNLYV